MAYKDPEEQRRYQRQWVAKRRSDYLRDKSCVKCGSTEQLEIDHVDAKRKVHHTIWSWSKARREKELAKCQVLCRKHHKEKSEASLDGTYAFDVALIAKVHTLRTQEKMSIRQIASVTGMSSSHVHRIVHGESRA